jgi:hypothetical protein
MVINFIHNNKEATKTDGTSKYILKFQNEAELERKTVKK